MAISTKEKELVAIAISVAAGCKPCTDHHMTVARKADATSEQIMASVDAALAVRRRAADIMEAHALAHFGEEREVVDFGFLGEPDRIKALVSVGSAFAVNCVTSLRHHVAAAEISGVSHADIEEIAKLATFIKHEAVSHVVDLVVKGDEKAA